MGASIRRDRIGATSPYPASLLEVNEMQQLKHCSVRDVRERMLEADCYARYYHAMQDRYLGRMIVVRIVYLVVTVLGICFLLGLLPGWVAVVCVTTILLCSWSEIFEEWSRKASVCAFLMCGHRRIAWRYQGIYLAFQENKETALDLSFARYVELALRDFGPSTDIPLYSGLMHRCWDEASKVLEQRYGTA